jgi:hypothetical protein
MTHDELLAQLEGLWHDSFKAPGYKALRTVVELHKPESNRMPFCVVCRGVWQGEIDVVLYPCPTIQAIEKELK